MDNQIKVTEIISQKTSEKKRTIDFKMKSDISDFSELNGKLTLNHSKGCKREIINQTDSAVVKEFVEAVKDGIELEIGLKNFMAFDKKLDFRLLIY